MQFSSAPSYVRRWVTYEATARMLRNCPYSTSIINHSTANTAFDRSPYCVTVDHTIRVLTYECMGADVHRASSQSMGSFPARLIPSLSERKSTDVRIFRSPLEGLLERILLGSERRRDNQMRKDRSKRPEGQQRKARRSAGECQKGCSSYAELPRQLPRRRHRTPVGPSRFILRSNCKSFCLYVPIKTPALITPYTWYGNDSTIDNMCKIIDEAPIKSAA